MKGIRTALVHRIGIYVLSLIILPVSWLASSGLVSPSIIYSLTLLLLMNFLLTGRERLILNTLFLLIHIGLIGLYRFYPGIFKSMTAHEQFLDWIINVPIVFIFIAFQLVVFEQAYERERVLNAQRTEHLEIVSCTDPLTGLTNRLNLNRDIDSCIQDFRNNGTVFSIVILDVDYFKNFNDTYGHIQGDECLKIVSSLLQASVHRAGDKVYRFGGEEFLVLLSGTDLPGAIGFSEQLKTQIANAAIPHENSSVSSILTVSMGVAVSNSSELDSSTLLKQADTALYEAKNEGRNRIAYYKD